MTRFEMACKGRWLVFPLAFLASPVLAQNPANTQIVAQPPSTDPSDRLAANLVVLSQNPNDVGALTEAGISAVAVGDGTAALSFLSRAEVISPKDGAIKAAIGSALLLMEKPGEALKLFAEASALGLPEHIVARDRGLAHDLRGDQRRAQRDYALALKHGPDDEVTRRYALSLGISGDRDPALRLLEPMFRVRDLSSWRARAFILAMTGDEAGAEVVASSMLPGGAGASMAPFLRRLAKLNGAARALAVNFGIMPSDGQTYAIVDRSVGPATIASAVSDALIPAGDPFGPRPSDVVQQTERLVAISKEPRRRPGRERDASSPSKANEAPATPGATSGTKANVETSVAASPIATTPAASISAPKTNVPQPQPQPQPESLGNVARRALPVVETPVVETPAVETPVVETPASVTPQTRSADVVLRAIEPISEEPRIAAGVDDGQTLGALIASIQPEQESQAGPLPSVDQIRAARIAAQRKAANDTKLAAEKAEKEAARLAARKHPARIWVQVATGANEAGMPMTWKRLREKSPDALKGLSANMVPFKATNRLLVGPFSKPADARALVNTLAKAGMPASTFSSQAGQEIAKVSTR